MANEVHVNGLKHQKEKRSMDHFAGLDVSVKETSVCIVDEMGKIVREVKVASEPEALLAVLANPAYHFALNFCTGYDKNIRAVLDAAAELRRRVSSRRPQEIMIK